MRKNIDMIVKMTAQGKILPCKIIWHDGTSYEIDKITDIRNAASLKAGGCGVRYTCSIGGQVRYIYLDNGIWFIE